jgi:hypothetical protein
LGALTRIDAKLDDGTRVSVAALDIPLDRIATGDTVTFAYDPDRVTTFAS